jgi:hypothetical protein
LTQRNEVQRSRAALGQLFEYRYFHGEEGDLMCLVTNRPIADVRSRLLASFDVGVIYTEDGRLLPGGLLAPVLGRLSAWKPLD